MCGYATKCYVDGKSGTHLGESLMQKQRENENVATTVAESWGYMLSRQEIEHSRGHIARAVYWPECEMDTLQGVRGESVTAPHGPYDLSRLEKTEFPRTPTP